MDIALLWKAALLGLVEGLTEFLPVSSTGHLILFGDLLKFNDTNAALFDVVIQSGAIAAVLFAYWQRFFNVLLSFFQDGSARKFVMLLLLGFLPAAIIGGLFHHDIKTYLFNTTVVAWSLIAGGIIMLVIDRLPLRPRTHEVEGMSYVTALKIGLIQCLAMVPGVSRSGATIIGGMLAGLDKKTAAEFSFFLAVPTLLAASAYDLYKNGANLGQDDWGLIATGFITSFVSGYLVIKAFITIVSRAGFAPFALYRIVLGAVLLLGLKT